MTMAHPKNYAAVTILHDTYEGTDEHYQQSGEQKMERPTADSEQLKAYTGNQQRSWSKYFLNHYEGCRELILTIQ